LKTRLDEIAGDAGRLSRVLPQRVLGKTGAEVSILGLGGVGILQEGDDDDQCLEIINEAIDLGINFIDTSHGYKRSELRVGMVMAERRDEVFLATKVDARDHDGIMRQAENSLKLLHTSQLDLLQIHHVYDADDVPAMGEPDGIFGTLQKLKDEGVTRFIGITGHPDYRKVQQALELYDWDTFMCFVNPSSFAVDSFEIQIPIARGKGMGLIGMKAFGGCLPARLIGDGPGQAGAQELLRYAFSMPLEQPIEVVIPGVCSVEEIRENVGVALGFEQMSLEECRELERRMRGV
jgi:uncharacterized protein